MKRYDWVIISDDNMYILEEWLVEFICDNVKKDELEYITRAFILLKPKDVEEAKELLEMLRKNDIRRIIDTIYERNKC